MELDVTGLSCPMPVVKVKEAIEAGKLPLQVKVSAGAPRDNVKRLAQKMGLAVAEKPAGAGAYWLELNAR
ncbi:MAG TPA: sulfurtransferase TusA family protein [Bacillota bacterium]|nr:sulfurtransferase TusA family protein [Bacillota bacterium]HPZ90261.1 sulfurtransferase TusA family protein [Bacillota bacterium]HQE01651.1 sulfurtransferase TusA family protein [Bacillota bacterium]